MNIHQSKSESQKNGQNRGASGDTPEPQCRK